MLVGKGIQSENSPVAMGFAFKVTATGTFVWGFVSGNSGADGINRVVELPSGDVLLAGYRNVGSVSFCSTLPPAITHPTPVNRLPLYPR